jgi:hypothetical protein
VKTATITIVDNDQGLAFSAPTFTVAETRPTAVISVRRTGGLTGTLVVNFATSPGTAVPGTDYTDTAGSLTFPPGVAIKTFSVPILNDTSNDGSRTVFLALTGVTPATVVKSPGTAVLTITDNEPVFQFALPAITVSEASGRATITVRRTARSAEITGVDYVVSGGTATNGTDYTLEAGTLTFFPNELVKTFSVTITNDGVDEPNETVLISLKENTGAATPTGIGTPGTTTLTITDNDVAGKIRFSAATYSVLESAGAATITLTRTGGTSNAATVIVTLAGGSASNGTHYTNAGPILVTFAANQASQSFPIAILSDGPTDSSNFITLTLGPFSGGALPGTITRADLWIVDAN